MWPLHLLSVLMLAASPSPDVFAIFDSLPLQCVDTEDVTDRSVTTRLRQCTPLEHGPKLARTESTSPRALVQGTALAMHRAGLSPVLRQAPLGPHLAWVAVDRIVSASFVVNEGKVIELWLSEQRFLAKQVEPLPTLPLGAEVLSEQVDGAGRRMLVIALSSELSTSDALRDAVFAALDIVPAETAAPSEARANPSARRLTHPGSGRSVANAGRIRWGRHAGFYEVTALGRAHSALTLYVGGAGNGAK